MFSGVGGFELGLTNHIEETQSQRDKKSWQDSSNTNGELSAQGGSKSTFSCIGLSSISEKEEECTGQEDEKGVRSGENQSNNEGNKGLGDGTSKTQQHNLKCGDRQFNCIGLSEIDKYASELLAQKFPTIKNWGDCTKIDPSELPDFDMLCGGFPCQSFSIAGKRKGFKDTRGTMFFEVARILKVKRPKLVFLENVKGLLNHDKGKTFRVILQTLEELGYRTQWMVLNSKFFGVPQNRERVFIIGSLRGTSRPEILPFGKSNGETKELVYVQKSDREIARIYDPKGIAPTFHLKTGGWQEPKISNFSPREFKWRDESPTLAARDYKDPKIVGEIIIPTNTKLGYDVAEERKDGIRLQYENSKTARGRVIKGATQALQAGGQAGVLDNMKVRRLTPIECERLQGFPNDWTKGFSDTQRYKMMGNAVTVKVIKAIGEKLI